MAVNLSPIGNDAPFVDSSGNPASGYSLYTYTAGSTTPQNTYTTSAGSVANANPIVLNSSGYPASGGNVVQIYLTAGVSYKFVLKDGSGNTIWTRDNISGINDTTVTIDQWVSGPAPTYISATSFSLVGDQTTTFHAGRRLKTTNSGGTVYSTIATSTFGAVTTITVVNDSGTLDSGLSAVSYGLLSSSNPSVPNQFAKRSDGLHALVNGYLAWSVSGNALTVAVKTLAGNNPTSGDPVYAEFRSTTAATGTPVVRTISAATSITVPDTALLGTVNSQPFRIWATLFDTGSGVEVGVINAATIAANAGSGYNVSAIYPLAGWGIASSSAVGTGSDSAATFYTTNAQTSKGFAVVGYATWESGLATAGTWSAGPDRVQLYGPDVSLPGRIVQSARSDTGAVATGTTVTVYDDTIPQNTEGDQYMSQAVTPTSAANALRVTAKGNFATSAAGSNALIMSLFKDSVANALASALEFDSAATVQNEPMLFSQLLAGSSSAITMKIRAGYSAAGTTTFNGSGSARKLGGAMNSFLHIDEVMV